MASSGRTVALGSSHFGPPTAPKRTAREAADGLFFVVEFVAEALFDAGEDFNRFGHDLWADAVAGREQNGEGRHCRAIVGPAPRAVQEREAMAVIAAGCTVHD
jgi:hypothetical protein